jgi:glycosyltransferase involved in cell wall biosynthesis
LRILGINPNENIGAVEAYRVVYPLHKMSLLGHQTWVMPAMDVAKMVKDGHNPFAHLDMVLVQRLTGGGDDWKTFVTAARAAGCSIVVDYDDDYTNEYRKVCEGGIPDLSYFSAITVSTPYLKRVMRKYNRNVVVIPNLVVPEVINGGFKRKIGGLCIGLTGSETHREDWQVVIEPLKQICQEFPDVSLFVSGYLPDELRSVPNLVTLRSLGMVPGMETDNFYIPLKEYGFILRNIDILLAPVDPDDKFNHSKSNLKAIEGQMSARPVGSATGGCMVIASGDLPNYQDAIKGGRTGLLVDHHNQDAWYEALREVITNPKHRVEMQIAGYESCLKNWNIHTRIGERVAAYHDICEWDKRQQPKLAVELAGLATGVSK